MKKFIFILIILLWSGVLVLLSFSREAPSKDDSTVNIDFSEWEKLSSWNTNKKTFTEISLTGSRIGANTIYMHQFSPIDSIYYKSGDKQPLVIEKRGGVNIVTFGSGLFVCNIQTGLEKYEFHSSDITIIPRGRGVFLVDTTHEQAGVFSFDTFLDTELVSGAKRLHITSFTLFPSLLFKHDPRNTLDLKEADIIRISLIDTIRYVDMKTVEDRKILFPWDSANTDEVFLTQVQKDISARINAFVELYTSISEQNNKKMEGTSFLNTTSALLINGSKKEVILKNILTENILWLLRYPEKTQYKTIIESTISEMKELSPKVYADGLSILRQYYYITLFSHFAVTDNLSLFSWQESPLLLETEKIITNNIQSKQGEYYTHLSNIFSVYYFLTLSQDTLNSSFEKILQKIIENKVLTKNEFLPFAFFVTQYLSTGPAIPNEATMLTISHLFQITNDYYASNKSEKVKLATIASTTFYNYTKIFTKMQSVFFSTFVDKTSAGLLLKKDYTDGENTNLDQNFIDAFIKVINTAKKDAENKKNALYSKDSFQSDSQVIDSYSLLGTTLRSFDTLISMFSNYPKYLNDFHLNESNKSTRGILIEKGNAMSREILQTYLKDFNNLDVSSLQVKNNFQKDGFYEIQVNILGNIFYFKLWEQNHILADISYTDTFWKKHTFPNITIPLDEKKEQLKELFSSSTDPVFQYKYDFKNFFEITFLKGDTLVTKTVDPEVTTSAATPEIQLFIQKELLDKDFKNIESFLPIKFKNIDASISEWVYVIKLSDINKAFMGENNNYPLELSGKYIFNRHSFSRLTFKVKRDGEVWQYEFGGTPVEILPARISLLSLPEILKNLGYYIDSIGSSYSNQQSIIIDLTGGKVLLDGIPFIPKFPIL